MSSKDCFEISLSKGTASSLAALPLLTAIDPTVCFHLSNDLRLPLGIYNTSVLRIAQKVVRLCESLEKYIRISADLAILHEQWDLRNELIDYIELSLYAASEHVDDLTSIAEGFFTKKPLKNAKFRAFQTDIKAHKKFISASANAIKHQQARIRLHSQEFEYEEGSGCLHGYYIEGVHNGIVGPNVIFHQTQKAFSVSTLAWEIIIFVLKCSRSLSTFLMSQPRIYGPIMDCWSENFSKAVIAASRLPLYTFDEEHPFQQTTVILRSDEITKKAVDSGIYGSLLNKWRGSDITSFGKAVSEFEGDGVTRQFEFVSPSKITIQHWT